MNGDKSAFPVMGTERGDMPGIITPFAGNGLTKREYFAAMAMQGLCANEHILRCTDDALNFRWLGRAASKIADALLSELEKKPTEKTP